MPPSVHIADIDFPAFYASAFPNAGDSVRFFEEVEALPSASRQRVKAVLHQAARMLWLADRIDDVARGRPALQILFFLIAAEAVAKLAFNFSHEGKSRHYVHRFFEEICGDAHCLRAAPRDRHDLGGFGVVAGARNAQAAHLTPIVISVP